MPYKEKRQTLNKMNCRPKEFQSDEFPPSRAICEKKCFYWTLCKKQVSLEDFKIDKGLAEEVK